MQVSPGEAGLRDVEAGLALLQRLHARGALTLAPQNSSFMTRQLQLRPGDAMFGVLAGDCQWALPTLLRLAVEAGPDITALWVECGFFRRECWREVLPAMQRRGRVRTLCMRLAEVMRGEGGGGGEEEERGLWGPGVVPPCVERVRVLVPWRPEARKVRALVRGAAAAMAAEGALWEGHAWQRERPLTLTLLHEGGWEEGLEEELRGVVDGEGGGLKLEVVRVSWAHGGPWT